LQEKPVVSPVHGRVQAMLALWFGQREEEWSVQVLVETRTKVSGSKVRLPDVSVLAAGPLPRRALVEAPRLVIEVLSETDTYAELKDRAADLQGMGVENIWLLDPERRTAERWQAGSWLLVREDRLEAAGSPVYLDLAWLWKKLRPQG